MAQTSIIRLHTYGDAIETIEVCNKLLGRKAAACAVKDGQLCEVHVTRPGLGVTSDWVPIGHEFWHCYYGDWHEE